MKLRLDKYLADMGIGTRTEVKKAITKGQVRVNEETVKRPEIKIDTEKDHVFYQGQMVAYTEYEYCFGFGGSFLSYQKRTFVNFVISEKEIIYLWKLKTSMRLSIR